MTDDQHPPAGAMTDDQHPPAARPRPTLAELPEGGRAEFFLGPMFSGKTTEILRLLRRARHAGLNSVFVKHAADTRYAAGPSSFTHDGVSIAGRAPGAGGDGGLRVVEAAALGGLELGPDECDVGVDEGQFFPDLRDAVDRWVRAGRRVYVAALDGDFRRQPFAAVSAALPLAARISKLSAVCMRCRASGGRAVDAPFTARTTPETAVELVGGREMYQAVCLGCYLAHTEGGPETGKTLGRIAADIIAAQGSYLTHTEGGPADGECGFDK